MVKESIKSQCTVLRKVDKSKRSSSAKSPSETGNKESL